MLDILFLLFFVAMALYCLLAPERNFRSRQLRVIGATGFLVAAAAWFVALLVE